MSRIPTASISANIVVGPTKAKPSLRRAFDSAVDSAAEDPAAARGAADSAAGALPGLTMPAAAALVGSRVGLAGYLAGVASRALAARRTGARVGDALTHPVSVLALAALHHDGAQRYVAVEPERTSGARSHQVECRVQVRRRRDGQVEFRTWLQPCDGSACLLDDHGPQHVMPLDQAGESEPQRVDIEGTE